MLNTFFLNRTDATYNIVRFYGSGGVKDGDCYKPSLVKNILRVPYHMALSIKSSLTNHNQYLLAKEREKNFLEFNKYIIDQDEITPKTDYETLNAKYDYFVAGSDQVWNPNFYKMYINMLGFASSEKKVAVSPSVSVETLTDDHDPYRRCQKNADVIAPAIIYGYMLYCNGSNYRRE